MIRVVVDDLAFVEADAVLRAADEVLEAVTPDGVRLDRQGGPRFAQQRVVRHPLEAGAAVVTGGGDLAAPLVLHVVVRDRSTPGGRETVRRALVSAWQRAADWGLQTLAAPPVGAGAGQLALEEAAALLAETFLAARRPTGPGELKIVVEREAEREIIEPVVRRYA